MADILVSTQTLRDCGSSLRRVHADFKGADDAAAPDRSVIAHDRLRDRLDEFADSWNDRRDDMCAVIEGLGEAAEQAAEVYERIERELVAALEGA